MNSLFTLRTISPLHIGTGQSVGTTDLPIAREKATGWPVVPGTSVKGVVKDHHKSRLLNGEARSNDLGQKLDRQLAYLYGSPDPSAAAAGMVSFADAWCLFFPVRSFKGTFACVTCPLAIARLHELLLDCGVSTALPSLTVDDGHAVVHTGGGVSALVHSGKLLLEDIDLEARADDLAGLRGLLPNYLQDHVALVSNTDYTHFTQNATEVVTHVSLSFETKTARDGFLRSEERVPSEALFAGILRLDGSLGGADRDKARDEVKALGGQLLQFGGKASTGSGLCKWTMIGGAQ